MTLDISKFEGYMAKIGRRCLITGKVQGVFYRQATKEQALMRGLTGWVKNLHDGNVEALIFGEEEQVLTMLEWLAVGPPRAVVFGLEVSEIESETESESEDEVEHYQTFEIIS
jgi:acylphosphatase